MDGRSTLGWRLAAVMAADVVGYTRLTANDEIGTLRRFHARRAGTIEPLIASHSGWVFDAPGDCLMCLFSSIVEAVTCAARVQEALIAAEAGETPERRIRLRIGLTTDEVLVDNARAYGNGVNLAARLQALADPDGICVSQSAWSQISGRVPYATELLGLRRLKNFPKPVRVWRILPSVAVTATSASSKVAFLPARPPGCATTDAPGEAILCALDQRHARL